MATSFRLEHHFPKISLAKFEKYLNHKTLNEMLSGMPAFRSRELIEQQSMPNGDTHWKFKVIAGGDLPPAISKVISPDMFTWIETSRFVPDEHCIYFSIEPIVGKEKFSGAGKWLLQKDKKGTKRVIEGEIAFKIPFVGKLVESYLVKELTRNFEVEPEIQNRFYDMME